MTQHVNFSGREQKEKKIKKKKQQNNKFTLRQD